MRPSLLSALLFFALAAACTDAVTRVSTCDPACASGEICDQGLCRPDGSDAGQTLACDPACPAWETCVSHACVMNPGRCSTNADCPATLPICDSTNTCVAPALTQPKALTYAALIVTNQAYAAGFQELAQLHTLTGVPTQVVTLEDICAATTGGCSATDACHDTPKALKDYLIKRTQGGLKQVVLGGDNDAVPSRLTRDHYSNTIYQVDFDETFYSDYYFSDLSNWDDNHDCTYGDAVNDSPSYSPTLGVTRVSVSSTDELTAYIGKAQAYLTNYDTTRLNTALFLSNVATEVTIPVVNATVPVDAALYFEGPGRTLSLIPSTFDVTKLYSSLAWPGAQPLTVTSEEAAFQQGYNIVVHSGHGAEEDVTVEEDGSNEFTGTMAHGLANSQFPILISCACEAATFADGDACAGQQFLTAPSGGGIGYLGNSTIGLGIAGGMQFIDSLLRYAFSQHNPLVGDAVIAAHLNMPTSDAITIPNVPIVGSVSLSVIDKDSWRWTQKAATWLGDGLLPIYTDVTLTTAPAFTAQRTAIGNFSQIAITPSAGKAGTLAAAIGASVYEFSLTGSGAPVTITVAGAPAQIAVGFSSASTLAAYQKLALP